MDEFDLYLKKCSARVDEYFRSLPEYPLVLPELREGAFAYFLRGGKRLRPAILSAAAGMFGGKEKEKDAIPCAVGIEFYHNYTLIHDDIIDNDDTRRGKPSVHILTADMLRKDGFSKETLAEYGRDNAILSGDVLRGAAIHSITRLAENKVSAEVILKIISLLEGDYGMRLLAGEAVDTKNGVLGAEAKKTAEEDVISMMAGKTGALFAASAVSGALIGLDSANDSLPEVRAVAEFAENCGIAFQLQDDYLGLTSTTAKLGKPVLSDLREGKATVLYLRALSELDGRDKKTVLGAVGSEDERVLLSAKDIIMKTSAVKYTKDLAAKYLSEAKKALLSLPASEYRDILGGWMRFMTDRDV